MSESLITSIERILKHCAPGGQTDTRLRKYLGQIERNVLLGPSVLRYIRRLEAGIRRSDTVECRYVTGTARCRKTRMLCSFQDNQQDCPKYDANKAQTQGSPMEGVLE